MLLKKKTVEASQKSFIANFKAVIKAGEVKEVPIGSVKLWKDNPRKNEDAAVKLAEMIKIHGQISPIVVWKKNNVIYKGNTTWKAMQSLGMKTIRALFVDFPSESSAIAYGISDNKSSEWSEWDDRILNKIMKQDQFSFVHSGLLSDSNIQRDDSLIIDLVTGEKNDIEDVKKKDVININDLDTNSEYHDFLKKKIPILHPTGFTIDKSDISKCLFDFQSDLTRWAVLKGRCAIFAGTGLGKTLMQIEWCRIMSNKIKGKILIVCPLSVASQTIGISKHFFNIDICHVMNNDNLIGKNKIFITNYERVERLDLSHFQGIVLDESSILKSYDGSFRNMLIEKTIDISYKLCCSATPAPNDYMEIGNHAEFLGVMTRSEMLAMYFTHDGARTSQWRVKGHAKSQFWTWISSWAAILNSPSDLGYDDKKFKLPILKINTVIINKDIDDGNGIKNADDVNGSSIHDEKVMSGLRKRLINRRLTLSDRCLLISEIVKKSTSDYIVIWCYLNGESEKLKSLIPDAIELKGTDPIEVKEKILNDFSAKKTRILITKPSLSCFGLNWQFVNYTIFCGISDSFEEYYQAIRRFWRFGQDKEVIVDIVLDKNSREVLTNIQRKEFEFINMQKDVILKTQEFTKQNLTSMTSLRSNYKTAKNQGKNFAIYMGDCVDVLKNFEKDSIDYSIFSPPFKSLYTYSDLYQDMGNVKTDDDFYKHFLFFVKELFRVIRSGRNVSFHCMNIPTSKCRDGYIGMTDFRGDLIRCFQNAGFIYHSEVVIWKDPVTAMQRTKALGLLHKQLKKDAAMCRQGIPDYLITVRKPGENRKPVINSNFTFPVKEWQGYASPVWMDIKPGETLQRFSARDNNDERHICPLQLEVIRRAVRLWSLENDIVLSPFMGIGSEGYIALQMKRKFVGIELKESYFKIAESNLKAVD